MLDSRDGGEENVGWPGYVDFLSTFVFVLIIFIGSLLYLLSGDINKRVMEGLILPVETDCRLAGLPCERVGNKVRIPLSGKVEFATNQVAIRADQERFLREVGRLFTKPGVRKIMIRGLADSQKCTSDPFCNWDISARRALEVIKFYYNCTDCGYGTEVQRLLILSGEGDTDSSGDPNSKDRRVDVILDFETQRN